MELGVVTEFFHIPLSQRVSVAIDITAKVVHLLFAESKDDGLPQGFWHCQHRPRTEPPCCRRATTG